ncbi:uncharacterized protein LOC117809962 [Notolabrus celidotus]|uniref:uncharacterized protein LOC117809962 n=1 Tax=Notolabrus celidotus TaxID=1203425 RepID=UPI00148F73BC|nr:uncharacterized protein LOC117809962 [Notolabrus celidotus]
MAAQAELCCLEGFPSHISPLDVLILRSHLDLVLQRDTDPQTVLFTPQTVLFTPHRPPGSRRTDLLLRVHQTTEEETLGCSPPQTESGTRVLLFTSPLFLEHHSLQRSGSTGTVRALEPVCLDRVVLGARSRQTYSWAKSERFTRGLLDLCGPGQGLLARRGDPLPGGTLLRGQDPGQDLMDLLVLDCSPVTQGRITADTSLVVTYCLDSVDPPGPAPSCRPPTLFVSDFAQCADSLSGGSSLLDNRKLSGSGFTGLLQALECSLDVRVVDARRWSGVRGHEGGAVDVDRCVFVSKQLLLRFGIFNGAWVKLSRPGGAPRPPPGQTEVSGGGARERLVSMLVVDLTQSPDLQEVGFISETLWFNMTDGDQIPETGCSLRMKNVDQGRCTGSGSKQRLFKTQREKH